MFPPTPRDLSVQRDGLAPFRDPRSVAVVGASDDPAKWGCWLAKGALTAGETRRVWLVNHAAAQVQGQQSFASVASLPETPELVVLCVPAAQVAAVIEEALARGGRSFLAIAAGVAVEDELRARLSAAGARLIGPNSLGIYDASSSLQLAWGHFTPGCLAIVSQSGQVGSEIANLAGRAGLGVSRFVSVGNQVDVHAVELLDDLVEHEATRLVAVYLESFADGEHLVGVLRRLRDAGKPTLVLATGGSDGSRRLAASHTGSMTSALDIVDAACRVAGAVRVHTPAELVAVARYLRAAPIPQGRRVAVVSDSGGQGGIAADVTAAVGLETPTLSRTLQDSLAEILPAAAAVSNPIDLAGAAEAGLSTYAQVCERLVASGEVDAVVVSGYLGCFGEDAPSLEAAETAVVDRLGELARCGRVPLVVHSMSTGSPVVNRMWDQGLATFGAIEMAMKTLAYAQHLAAYPGRATVHVPASDLRAGAGYWSARGLLAELGVALPEAAAVSCLADLQTVGGRLRGPYVLKASWLEHKSEHDGVVLGIQDLDGLREAFREMHARLGEGDYVVEEQDCRRNVVETVVAARRDPGFGPTVTVGAGGTETELWRDVRVELAPVDRMTARAMIDALRSRVLLSGWRGRPAVDVEGLVDVVVAVSEAICADPTIAELELNPVRVAPEGALVVDALITRAAQTSGVPPAQSRALITS